MMMTLFVKFVVPDVLLVVRVADRLLRCCSPHLAVGVRSFVVDSGQQKSIQQSE
jgi:hypothetical protein